MIPQILLLVGGIGALYFGAEWLIHGAASLARRFGVSAIVVGLTVVSLGTSAPELAVSLLAVFSGSGGIAIGNVLGSNLANVGLVLGLSAVLRPLLINARVVSREVPIMLVFTVLLFPIMMDGEVSRGDGAILAALMVGYLVFVFRTSTQETPEVLGEFEQFIQDDQPRKYGVLRDLGLIAVGVGALLTGGYAIVESATFLATAFGVPDRLVALTVVALGTSLPELATSVVAALRQEADIAVGNVIGSNIFNIGSVLGITAMAHPIAVAPPVLRLDLPAVLILSFMVLPFARTRLTIARLEGALLVATYAGLGIWIFW